MLFGLPILNLFALLSTAAHKIPQMCRARSRDGTPHKPSSHSRLTVIMPPSGDSSFAACSAPTGSQPPESLRLARCKGLVQRARLPRHAAAQFLPSFHGTHGHTVVRMLRTLIATFGSIKRSGLADQDEKIAEVLLGLETVGPCVLARY